MRASTTHPTDKCIAMHIDEVQIDEVQIDEVQGALSTGICR